MVVAPEKNYLVAITAEELFQQLRRLKQDEQLRARSVTQRRTSVESFTIEKTVQRWKKLIQEISPQCAREAQQQ